MLDILHPSHTNPSRTPTGNSQVMTMTRMRHAGFVVSCAFASSIALAQTDLPDREWRAYGGDLGHTRYAPLDQINASNFGSLEVAWRFSVANLGPTPEMRFQSTPLVVDGVLYTTGGSRRAVTALDAATGEQLWVYSLNEGARGAEAPRRLSGRGLAFWQRGDDKRVVYVTPGYQLVALNAATGRPIESFGEGGIVDLVDIARSRRRLGPSQIGTNSPPTIANDVIMVPRRAHAARARRPGQERHRLHPRLRRRHRASCSGRSTPCRGAASRATRRGRTARPRRAAATPASGRRSRRTRSSGSRICPSNRRTATCTAACGPARISTAKASSPWTFAPASTAGIFKRRIIRSGTTTFRRRRSSSTP